MNVLCFSSFTFSYLDRARVLFESVKKWHPDWRLVALVTDVAPDSINFDLENEIFDEIVFASDLGISNFRQWLFRMDLVEACTAVKGPFLAQFLATVDAIVYLDPDICLFSRLDCVDLIEHGKADIILTPHQLVPESSLQAVADNEITSLATGVYNLGFIAVANNSNGNRFASWWAERLLRFCYDDIPKGLFVDQRWCDHIPVFFENVALLKDPGYNVASWNLSNRTVEISTAGAILINKYDLRFWHFTKLGPVGDAMTKRYAGNNLAVFEIWNWYRHQVKRKKVAGLPPKYWNYSTYADGAIIEKSERIAFRSIFDKGNTHIDPFLSSIDSSLRNIV